MKNFTKTLMMALLMMYWSYDRALGQCCDSICENLVTNGSFEQGETGFTTGYQVRNGTMSPGDVSVLNNASQGNAAFKGLPQDGDSMLVVDGESTVFDLLVWGQCITVEPDQTYCLSFWLKNVKNDPNKPLIRVLINNQPVQLNWNIGGTPFSSFAISPAFVTDSNEWIRVCATWGSGPEDIAAIELVDLSHAVSGNDFAIDNIQFGRQDCDQIEQNCEETCFWTVNGNAAIPPSGQFRLGTRSANPVRFISDNTQRMILTTGGDLGIGKNAPMERLHVLGNAVLEGTCQEDHFAPGLFFREHTRTDYWALFKRGSMADLSGTLPASERNMFRLSYFNGSGWVNCMAYDVSGNVTVHNYMGIGVAPQTSGSLLLDVGGDVQCVTLNQTSDLRLKENIKPLSGSMDRLKKLRPVEYDYKAGVYKLEPQRKVHSIGFIAQEMKEVLPELVTVNADGMHAVNYSGVIPLLVDAVTELDQKVAESEPMKKENESLHRKIDSLQADMANMRQMIMQICISGCYNQVTPAGNKNGNSLRLECTPNPTSSDLQISYSLPGAGPVQLELLSSSGQALRTLDSGNKTQGNHTLSIDTRQLARGMYMVRIMHNGSFLVERVVVN